MQFKGILGHFFRECQKQLLEWNYLYSEVLEWHFPFSRRGVKWCGQRIVAHTFDTYITYSCTSYDFKIICGGWL